MKYRKLLAFLLCLIMMSTMIVYAMDDTNPHGPNYSPQPAIVTEPPETQCVDALYYTKSPLQP